MIDIPPFVATDLERIGAVVTDQQLSVLAAYLDLLLETNQRFNLTAIRDPEEAWRRHIIDSLTLLPGLTDLPEGASLIDVGAGGGLPGIPLAICLPAVRVVLVEATGKKARFLSTVAEALELANVTVLGERAEIVGQDRAHREQYDVAVCRAIGPMPELLEYTLPLLRVGGRLLALKGPSVESELDRAGDALTTLGAGEIAVFAAYPDGFDLNTVIVDIEKVSPTPRPYPRRPGIPRQEPL